MQTMEWLIWIGAALTLVGVVMLLWCIKMVMSIRKRALPDAETRAAMHKAVALNMAALGISGLGLMMAVIGVMLS
jgi:hypothetical protein